MKKNILYWVFVLVSLLLSIHAFYLVNKRTENAYSTGYRNGFVDGGNIGVDMALDTIIKIARRQIYADTIVSRVLIETDAETLDYFLSKKTLLK